MHNRTWENILEVEIASFEWVSWQNTTRTRENLGYQTPQEIEDQYWQHARKHEIIGKGTRQGKTQTVSKYLILTVC
ncbi:hypothetical protein HHJ74_11335 [Mobiluncus mulieris]|uniref:Uncharacterized protein n=1 Tax=Mobiluncus mulieris TaxID=2052 RepID=A0A848RJW0_9ACTO|nr:hypothetical protein [Mobiluncus mulieris]MCU9972201.1 hypothetical protein [Mobiluncus mulieris]MCU9976641.1 hypothetical protein [Mobiluncus mulieris]MCV0014919.1 hypothetical protein [Mobiluncus mulieris]NMW92048.1 hypothetical protein [Mobiluncus mulieris]NMW94250.1 hypothetical protein [Mobiluncus mulieris]